MKNERTIQRWSLLAVLAALVLMQVPAIGAQAVTDEQQAKLDEIDAYIEQLREAAEYHYSVELVRLQAQEEEDQRLLDAINAGMLTLTDFTDLAEYTGAILELRGIDLLGGREDPDFLTTFKPDDFATTLRTVRDRERREQELAFDFVTFLDDDRIDLRDRRRHDDRGFDDHGRRGDRRRRDNNDLDIVLNFGNIDGERLRPADEFDPAARLLAIAQTRFADEENRTLRGFGPARLRVEKARNYALNVELPLLREKLRADVLNPPKPKPAGLVSGIVYSPDKSAAVIGTKIVYSGESLGDVKVVKIEADSVQFEKAGRSWTQKIGETPASSW